MDLQVRGHAIRLRETTRAYAEEKIGGAIKKVRSGEALSVDIEITDLAQGSGAPTFRVGVRVKIPHSKTQVVTVEDADVRAAIDVAADKILRAVKRASNKRRDKSRRSDAQVSPVGGPKPEDDPDAIDGSELTASLRA